MIEDILYYGTFFLIGAGSGLLTAHFLERSFEARRRLRSRLKLPSINKRRGVGPLR